MEKGLVTIVQLSVVRVKAVSRLHNNCNRLSCKKKIGKQVGCCKTQLPRLALE